MVRSWPDALVLHLNRFEPILSTNGGGFTFRRRDTPVTFPLRDLNVGSTSNPILYDCVSVSNHYGTRESGHYDAHAIRGDRWFLFNDDATPVVVDSPQTSIGNLNRNAYLLYYVRRQPVAVAMI